MKHDRSTGNVENADDSGSTGGKLADLHMKAIFSDTCGSMAQQRRISVLAYMCMMVPSLRIRTISPLTVFGLIAYTRVQLAFPFQTPQQ
ncbi:hypothetical protein ACET3X_008316 [Alternaria dauci]|uniref:Uncharacterized protein n=1 Tax=Alternaria dauci TaxID=48095 RepID=A0ABR3UBU4_9PLEO